MMARAGAEMESGAESDASGKIGPGPNLDVISANSILSPW